MTKQLYFNLDPDAVDAYGDISDVLKDTIKRFDSLNKTVMKAERQLLKFDEINRLVAYEVTEKTASSGKSSSGGSSKSSSKSSTTKKETTGTGAGTGKSTKQKSYEASLPMYITIKDVLFNWDDLNWEQIMMKIIAGLGALGGAIIGGMVGGVPGAIIGLGAGLLFGIALDSTIFNFDGELQKDEIWKSLLAVLAPIAGGILGFVAGGPFGAALGITVTAVLSFVITGTNWDEVLKNIYDFFDDLRYNLDLRIRSLERLIQEGIDGIRNWWRNLSFDSFHLKLPHLVVEWQELNANGVLARFLGVTAIPHLSVEWYARGGIVDGATLIGAGEKGKEAIIPLERNTGWIHMVAVQLTEELEKLSPSDALSLVPMPAAATGALIPPSAAAPSAPLDLDSLANTIANAIAGLSQEKEEPIIRVYLDGKEMTRIVTQYQRRNNRAFG
ncbi:MAG: hypothetical protein IKS55_15410 [Oscillospiraceae bacterium]|nr:hypothetical protein [Oscillospiraceae bacterium]